jgi:hypothetical protein
MFRWIKWLFEMEKKEAEVSPAEKVARTAFTKDFPEVSIHRSLIPVEEPERFIVMIIYHSTIIPPQYKLYAVDKDSMEPHYIPDDKTYRSRWPSK